MPSINAGLAMATEAMARGPRPKALTAIPSGSLVAAERWAAAGHSYVNVLQTLEQLGALANQSAGLPGGAETRERARIWLGVLGEMETNTVETNTMDGDDPVG